MGFRIAAEEMVAEQGKYYVIIRAVPGTESYGQEVDYIYGRRLAEDRDKVFLEFLQKERERVSRALEGMEGKELCAGSAERKQELLQMRKMIESILEIG